MARPRLGAPFDLTLPSGAKAEVTARRSPTTLPGDLVEAIELGAVQVSTDPKDWPLADANVLETVLAALGCIAAPHVPLTCRNCGESIEIEPASAVPLAPLLAPLGDPELDPPVDRVEWHAFDAPVQVGRKGTADRFRLARRTLRDRVRLEEILGDDETAPLPLGAPLIRALGLDALGVGEGEPRVVTESAIAIARALEGLDDEAFGLAWDTITRAYDHQHWPPRLLAPVACPHCGARHDVEVVERPLAFAPERSGSTGREFPDLSEFTSRADAVTREVFGDDEPNGLAVVVEDGVPPCDDGGEPLLGSYTPDVLPTDGRVQGAPFVIALYYRTFRSMWDDEPYDVDAEIRETIEHELEHHEGFLAGHDPLDDEERAAIVTEHQRLAGIRPGKELAASASWLATDIGRFLRATWPIWLLVLVATLLVLAGDR